MGDVSDDAKKLVFWAGLRLAVRLALWFGVVVLPS